MLITKLVSCAALAGTLLGAGCGGQNASRPPVQAVYAERATRATVLQAAQEVLSRMQFPIEKLDVEQGIVRTRPLRGAQFFEFWRRDNASGFDVAEANLQTIRRTVELRVEIGDTQRAAPDEARPAADVNSPGRVRIVCEVSVQRLSLPENEIPSISQTFRMHSESTATAQRVAVTPQQERAMAWMDSGKDPALAAKILKQVCRRLERLN
jgi:hypothetical protein